VATDEYTYEPLPEGTWRVDLVIPEFVRDTVVSRLGKGFRSEVIPDWDVWSPNGGYLASFALRTVEQVTNLPFPSCITVQFLSKAKHGPIDLSVRALKSTSRSECFEVVAHQEVEIFQAIVWTGAEAEGLPARRVFGELPRPGDLMTSWQRLGLEGPLPGIQSKIEERQDTDSVLPFREQPSGSPEWQGWVRFLPGGEIIDPFGDCARCVVVVDIYSTLAAFVTDRDYRMRCTVPTISLAVAFLDPSPRTEFLYCRACSKASGHALLTGTAEVFAEDGGLVATATQVARVNMIKPIPPALSVPDSSS
jgi:acyl-CoA thioesterase II